MCKQDGSSKRGRLLCKCGKRYCLYHYPAYLRHLRRQGGFSERHQRVMVPR